MTIVSYDMITSAFVGKLTDYKFIYMDSVARQLMVDDYMRRACAQFNRICLYNLAKRDDENRVFLEEFDDEDADEIVDIISEGMLAQWLRTYIYNPGVLENTINTKDFETYSPAELLHRVQTCYDTCRKTYKQMMNDYSYSHGDLSDLHL